VKLSNSLARKKNSFIEINKRILKQKNLKKILLEIWRYAKIINCDWQLTPKFLISRILLKVRGLKLQKKIKSRRYKGGN
jgi:hypothetical protein